MVHMLYFFMICLILQSLSVRYKLLFVLGKSLVTRYGGFLMIRNLEAVLNNFNRK